MSSTGPAAGTLPTRRWGGTARTGRHSSMEQRRLLTPACRALLVLSVWLTLLPFLVRTFGETAIRTTFYLISLGIALSLIAIIRDGVSTGRSASARRITKVDGIALLLAGVSVYGAAVGLYRDNSLSLVAGDLFRGVLLAASVVVGRYLWRAGLEAEALITIWRAVIVAECARLVIFLLLLAGGTYERFGSGSRIGTVLAVGYLLHAIPAPSRPAPRRGSLLFPAIVIFNAATSLERIAWLAIALTVVLLFIARSQFSLLIRAARRVLLVLAALGIIVLTTQTPVEVEVQQRVQDTMDVSALSGDSSFTSRESENSSSVASVQRLPDGPLLGGGHGFVYTDPLQAEPVHQIHNTYVSAFVRHGAIGASGLLAAGVAIAFGAIRQLRRDRFHIMAISVLVSFVVALATYSMIGDPIFGVFAGIVWARSQWFDISDGRRGRRGPRHDRAVVTPPT